MRAHARGCTWRASTPPRAVLDTGRGRRGRHHPHRHALDAATGCQPPRAATVLACGRRRWRGAACMRVRIRRGLLAGRARDRLPYAPVRHYMSGSAADGSVYLSSASNGAKGTAVVCGEKYVVSVTSAYAAAVFAWLVRGCMRPPLISHTGPHHFCDYPADGVSGRRCGRRATAASSRD